MVFIGVTFKFIGNNEGLDWTKYLQGIGAWRRAKAITICTSPSPVRTLIGFSGLPDSWIELIRRGEERIDRNTPYRWGYGFYIADSIEMYFLF